jgi:hypothetical protein
MIEICFSDLGYNYPKLGLVFWFLVFNTTFSYIMETSYSGGRSRSTRQTTGKLHHLRLRVECTFLVIYKAGREPTPYW